MENEITCVEKIIFNLHKQSNGGGIGKIERL